MFRSLTKGAVLGLALLTVLGVCSSAGAESDSQLNPPITGKKQAYMGDPTIHRGMELGWDRGYLAAKTDQSEGLSPDLGRHALYQDPKPMYRYEFGRRLYFYSGFRTGFLVGYRQGWNNTEVPYVAPRMVDKDEDNPRAAAGMEAEGMGPGMAAGPMHPGKAHEAKAPQANVQVQSDAL